MSEKRTGKPLSGTQQWALDWFKEHGPVDRPVYRNAGIAAGTVNSLIKAGRVECREVNDPRWRFVYAAVFEMNIDEFISATNSGRNAMIRAERRTKDAQS